MPRRYYAPGMVFFQDGAAFRRMVGWKLFSCPHLSLSYDHWNQTTQTRARKFDHVGLGSSTTWRGWCWIASARS